MRISLLLSMILLAINILSDIYIIKQLPNRFRNTIFKVVIWSINTLVYILFLVFVSLIFVKNTTIISQNIELVVFIFFLITLPKIIFLIISPLDYLQKIWSKKRKYYFTIVATIISIALFTTLLYGMAVGRKKIVCNNVEITSKQLPVAFNNFKIVQISDLHLKSLYGDTTLITSMVEKINSLNPDIVCITGDVVTLSADELLIYKTQLSKLKAKDGVYSVLGNHDYGDYVNWKNLSEKQNNLQNLKTYQKEMGWIMLNNESNTIVRERDSIVVIGVENWGNPPFPRYGDLNKSYHTLNDNKYKILLSHNPEHWQQVLDETNINLTLSGHTHAMQLKFSFGDTQYSLASLRGDWWSGLYQEGEQSLYVNDGIGCTLFTFRLGAYPEITLITLKSHNNE
ncbi:MAG: metallophosphoesterase [Bacteroidales bacterium]|nr:metallophosphoesterase [Bacteroidales bacterium]